MANDHVIDVKVRADTTGLSKGLADAEQGLSKAGAGFSKYGTEAEKASKQTQGFAEKNKAHMETVGKDAMIMGGALLAGIGLAVHAYSEFSSRMAQVQSLSHASAGEMDALTKSALTMGTAFGLSANDVADAEIELVKAGISVKEMMGGALPGALALAAAGQIDVGQATEIATIALTQFNLKGKDVPHVADLLAAGADKALGGVKDLGDALKQGGLVAAQFGFTIDDTVGTLSAFANAGMLGSDAGTSLKTMLLQLAAPSGVQANMMAKMGINAYDLQGKFIGVTALAGQLHDKLGPLADAQRNQALGTIFGSDAMRAASVLMKEGSAGIQKWIGDVNAQGFAAEQAAGKMNSLNGDFKKLQAAFETGLIKMGSTADGALRPMIQGITNLISGFSNLDPAMQKTIVTVAGFTGGALLVGGALLTTIPKIYETVKAVEALKDASPRAAAALGALGKAALPVAIALTALLIGQRINDSLLPVEKSVEDLTGRLIELGKGAQTVDQAFSKDVFARANNGLFGLKGMTEQIDTAGSAIKRLNDLSFSDNINDFMNGFINLGGKLPELRKSIAGIDSALGNLSSSGNADLAAKSFKQIADEASKQGVSVETTAKSFPQYMDSLRKLNIDLKAGLNDQELLNLAVGDVPEKMKAAQASTEGQAKIAEIAKQATAEQAKALDNLGLAADGTILHLDRLVQSMQASGLVSISADQAAINYVKSLEAVDALVLKNGKTLDINTAKGKENMEAWLGQASAADAVTLANAKNGMSSAELQVTLTDQYTKLRDNAIAFGKSGDEADAMARKALGIPKDVKIETAIQNYADSMAKAQALKEAVDRIPTHKEIDVLISQRTQHGTDALNDAQNGGPGQATGGAVYGSGPKGVDSERRVLAPGEHVLTDSDVDAMGGQAGVYAFRNQLHNGGGVRPMYAAAAPAAPAAMGGFSAPASMGDIYVQNPFTGEYLLATVDSRVNAGIGAANSDANRRPAR